jgi:hypothetical protein
MVSTDSTGAGVNPGTAAAGTPDAVGAPDRNIKLIGENRTLAEKFKNQTPEDALNLIVQGIAKAGDADEKRRELVGLWIGKITTTLVALTREEDEE